MEEGLSWTFFFPLMAAAFVYLGLYVAGNFLEGRGDTDGAERLRDISYALALLAAGYTAVLLLVALIARPGEVFDLVRVVLVVGVFFGLLLLLIFAIFELIASRGRRRSSL